MKRFLKRLFGASVLTLLPVFLLILICCGVVAGVKGTSGDGDVINDEYTCDPFSTIDDGALSDEIKQNVNSPDYWKFAVAINNKEQNIKNVGKKLNTISAHIYEKQLYLRDEEILQAFVYDLSYIDYIAGINDEQKRSDLTALNEEWETTNKNNITNSQKNYYQDILKLLDSDCGGINTGLPVDDGYVITAQWWNYPDGSPHAGLDISFAGTYQDALDKKYKIYAIEDGTVVACHNGERNNTIVESIGLFGAGNGVVIKSSNNTYLYMHMSYHIVKEGQPVRKGQLIGYMGSSGMSTGVHLHLEILRNQHYSNSVGDRTRTLNPCEVVQNLCPAAQSN